MAKRGIVVEDEPGVGKLVFPNIYSARHRPRFTGISFEGPGRTHQEFKDECNINVLMARYVKHGILPAGYSTGTYGDFSEVGDYLEAQQILENARVQFESLPATLRARFDNNPAKMLEFVADRGNLEEARKLGMLKDEPTGAPVPPVVPTDTK